MSRTRLLTVAAVVAVSTLVTGVSFASWGAGESDTSVADVPDGPRAPGLDLESAALAAAEAASVGLTAIPDLTSFYVKNVHGQDFGLDSGDSMGFSGFCTYSDNASQVGAGVEFPAGAVITSISAHFDDTDAAGNLTVSLYRLAQSGTGTESFVNLASASSSGSGGNQEISAVVSGGDGPSGAELVGTNEFFHMNLSGSDSDERMCGVEIFYNIPQDAADLVFTPVVPCRAYDSRVTTPFAADETRSISVIGSGDLSAQGGSATGCGVPGIVGSCITVCSKPAKAVAVNYVAISPTGVGQAQMWPADEAPPSGALVNYIPGANNSNATTVGIGQCSGALPSVCGFDLSLRSRVASGAHLSVIIVGYYSQANYASS